MAGVLEELMVKIGANTKDAERKIKGFEGVVEKAMGGVEQAGVAAAGGFAIGFTDALDVGASSSLVAAQLDLTAAESERVGGIAGALYADAYGESLGDVNEALRGIIAQTGELGDITDAELTGMGQNALDLAAIIGTDVARLTQVAGQAVSTGLADNMEEAFDQIAAASQKTMPGLQEDLLDAADEYGIFFAQLGLSGEQAFGMLAAASEQGMYGIDKTGDALKEFTIRAVDMSTGSVAAFDAIGLDAQEMAAQILAGGDTAAGAFDKIISGLLAMEDPVAQQTAAIGLFGTPLEDLSTGQIPEFLASLDTAESSLGAVGDAADTAGQTLNDNAQVGFMSLARTAKQDLGEAIMPLLPMMQGFLNVIIPIAPYLLIVAAAITAIVAALKIWKGVMIAVTVVQWLWNAALWANPITWIIAGIIAFIAIIVLLVVYWDEVVAGVVAAWNWLKEAGVAVWDWLLQFFKDWWPWLLAIFTGGGSLVLAWVIDHWDEIVAFVQSAVEKIGGFLSGMWDGIKDGLKAALNWAIGQINGAISGINVLISGANKVPGVNIPSIPSIPYLAEGGNILGGGAAMVGEAGPEILDLPRGARVTPLDRAGGGGGGRQDVYIHLDGDEDLVRLFRRAIKVRGGNVQFVLGSGR
jgi:hypothetical protein